MGWCGGGCDIAEAMIELGRRHVPKASRKEFFVGVIEALTDQDWDCQYDMFGLDPDFDDALNECRYGDE